MNRKSMIAIAMSFAVLSVTITAIATDTLPIEISGTGTASVNNAGPIIPDVDIYDGVDWVMNVDVDTSYTFFVNVSDTNTIDDIKQVTLELWVPGYQASISPTYRYKFVYTETTMHDDTPVGTWTQQFPTPGTLYLGACVEPASTEVENGSYQFVFYMEKTARAGTWSVNATVTDISNNKYTKLSQPFTVYKYLEMSYDTGGGSTDFSWTGDTGATNLADTLTITTTCNSPYTLGAAYENRFFNVSTGQTWSGEPVLEIKYASNPAVSITNYTSGFANWTSLTIPVMNFVTIHTIYLDYEGVLPALVYTGVTIYIRATV